jgi:hypothetical protein
VQKYTEKSTKEKCSTSDVPITQSCKNSSANVGSVSSGSAIALNVWHFGNPKISKTLFPDEKKFIISSSVT